MFRWYNEVQHIEFFYFFLFCFLFIFFNHIFNHLFCEYTVFARFSNKRTVVVEQHLFTFLWIYQITLFFENTFEKCFLKFLWNNTTDFFTELCKSVGGLSHIVKFIFQPYITSLLQCW